MYIELLIVDDDTDDNIEGALVCICFSNDEKTSYQYIRIKTNNMGYFIISGEPTSDKYSKVIFTIEKEGYEKNSFKEPIYELDHYCRKVYLKKK